MSIDLTFINPDCDSRAKHYEFELLSIKYLYIFKHYVVKILIIYWLTGLVISMAAISTGDCYPWMTILLVVLEKKQLVSLT